MTRKRNRDLSPSDIQSMYLDYLYGFIGASTDRNTSHSHRLLAEQLYLTPFTWTINNDDNRSSDGLSLREWFADTVSWGDTRALYGPCSMLEMMIALSDRASFMSNDDEGLMEWFWRIADNAGLQKYTDDLYLMSGDTEFIVRGILEKIISRSYSHDGRGGFFPLKHPETDQRKVELWYQMSAYLQENEVYTD